MLPFDGILVPLSYKHFLITYRTRDAKTMSANKAPGLKLSEEAVSSVLLSRGDAISEGCISAVISSLAARAIMSSLKFVLTPEFSKA